MFIYSMRAGTIRFFAIICVALITLVTLVAFVPEIHPNAAAQALSEESISFENVRTNEDRINFLRQWGWEVEQSPTEETTVTIPREFDKVFAAYNELQRRQGLDLSNHSGHTVERYTYTVTNYEGFEGKVYANLLVRRGRVIGGDICSADADGFVQGFERQAPRE